MSELKRIMIEMQLPETRRGAALNAAAAPTMDFLSTVAGITIDTSYGPVPIVGAEQPMPGLGFSALDEHEESAPSLEMTTQLLRATLEEGRDPKAIARELKARPGVVEVYSDVAIQPMTICPGSPPLGTDTTVETLLNVPLLRQRGLDGSGVMVAIVDTGINLAYLAAHGKTPQFNALRSWVPQAGLVPGSLPVNHGTMCAYDVCIAAPRCTLLDIAVLLSNASGGTIMEGLLSDAVRAYRHLLDIMLAPLRPGENRSLVVSNSWGMFNPSWDYPIGDPGNYSDNLNHPFNRIVTALERAGADILFAAGNCGQDCPDGRCGGVTDRAIYGANSHPRVLSVAGVDVTKEHVGYSSIGPGRLTRRKPDLCGFTHFSGSGVYAADGGTSAATPVVAGVVAAMRTRLPFIPGSLRSSPARVRDFMRRTAQDVGTLGYDYKHGYGVVNGTAVALLTPVVASPTVAAPELAEARCELCGSKLPAALPVPAKEAPRPAVEPIAAAEAAPLPGNGRQLEEKPVDRPASAAHVS
jgi:hypothetical protein